MIGGITARGMLKKYMRWLSVFTQNHNATTDEEDR